MSPLSTRSNSLYSGSGNTFVMIDNRAGHAPPPIAALVGDADGVIFLEQPEYTMRIFNRDGSEAEMCGNGLRCFIQFLADLGIDQPRYTVQTASGPLEGWQEAGEVVVTMPPPTSPETRSVDGYTFHFLNTGVPHAVTFDPVDDFATFGQKYVCHPAFGPAGTNVNHCSIKNGVLHVRTFERGVNRETGACGTGSTACALVASLPSPITVVTSSGETLTITLSPLTLRGKVSILAKL